MGCGLHSLWAASTAAPLSRHGSSLWGFFSSVFPHFFVSFLLAFCLLFPFFLCILVVLFGGCGVSVLGRFPLVFSLRFFCLLWLLVLVLLLFLTAPFGLIGRWLLLPLVVVLGRLLVLVLLFWRCWWLLVFLLRFAPLLLVWSLRLVVVLVLPILPLVVL